MIFTAFFSVGQQVLILFILICVGFICSKAGLLKSEGVPSINNLLLYLVTSAVIIEAFNREYDPAMLASLVKMAVAASAVHAINIAAATILVRDKNKARETVLRFGSVFSNCGFMALPLQNALFGAEGVFYGAAFIAVFNIFSWTYGLFLMGGKEAGFSAKNLILNPGIIAVVIGLFLFFSPVLLPEIILTPVSSLASLNTPVPMIIIGYYLSRLASLKVLRDAKLWLATFLRLVALPLIGIMLCYVAGFRGIILASVATSASAPVAASALVFAGKFNRDTELAATFVSVSTIVSIVTMPLLVSLAMVMP